MVLMKCFLGLVLVISINQQCVRTWTIYGSFRNKEYGAWISNRENGLSRETETLRNIMRVRDAYLLKITNAYICSHKLDLLKDAW